MLRVIVGSLRVRQWVKNGLVFAPLVFSGRLLDPEALSLALLSAASFCLASSGAYLMNDLLDRRVDRFHPVKKRRPVASGALALPAAAALLWLLVLAGVGMAFMVDDRLGMVILSYLLLNVAYSTTFKRIVILDVVTLSIGFVLRVWAGAVVLDLVPSHWLQLTVFFLALFLSLAKRRQELVVLHAKALRHRGVLSNYSAGFIDQLTAILTAVAILCYALYTVSPDVTARLGPFGFIATVPFVVYGVFRYLYLVHIKREALDPTEALLADSPMLVAALLWGLVVLGTLYWE
jgi:4-hydroxybenzoate polyprenyltransferase